MNSQNIFDRCKNFFKKTMHLKMFLWLRKASFEKNCWKKCQEWETFPLKFWKHLKQRRH